MDKGGHAGEGDQLNHGWGNMVAATKARGLRSPVSVCGQIGASSLPLYNAQQSCNTACEQLCSQAEVFLGGGHHMAGNAKMFFH